MDSSSQEGGEKNRITEVKTFPVQFALVEVKENIMEAIREVERMRQYCNNELGKIITMII